MVPVIYSAREPKPTYQASAYKEVTVCRICFRADGYQVSVDELQSRETASCSDKPGTDCSGCEDHLLKFAYIVERLYIQVVRTDNEVWM